MGFRELLLLVGWLLTPLSVYAESALVVTANGAVIREYTLEQLKSLPQTIIKTKTIWADGIQEFEGPSVSSILYDAGISDAQILEFKSLDDFSIDIPTFSVSRVYPIVAIKHNGMEMHIRNNGPFRIIYPYDDDPALKTEIIYARSVVMLSEINVQD